MILPRASTHLNPALHLITIFLACFGPRRNSVSGSLDTFRRCCSSCSCVLIVFASLWQINVFISVSHTCASTIVRIDCLVIWLDAIGVWNIVQGLPHYVETSHHPQNRKYVNIALSPEKCRGTSERPQVICTNNLAKSAHMVFEICDQTDKQTDIYTLYGHTVCNTGPGAR